MAAITGSPGRNGSNAARVRSGRNGIPLANGRQVSDRPLPGIRNGSFALPRFMIRCSILLAALTLTASAAEPLKILYISGGCCHDYTAQSDIIPLGLEERANVKVTVFQDPNTTTSSRMKIYEDANWAAAYDVIIHNECYSDTKDPEWTQRILKPHKDGKPGVVIHCAMHCYRDGTDEWFKFCGVTSHRHGAHYPHEVRNVDAAHPVMQGWGPAWANPAGELYWIEKVWPDTHILGESKNQEKGNSEPCVWTNNYMGRTRVFGTTLGHHNETVSDDKFLDLLSRGVLWAAGKTAPDFVKKPEAKRVPVNLALNKKGSASSTQPGNETGNAFDGKSGTRWCANGAQTNEWLQVDLEKPQTVAGARIAWEGPHASYQFKVEGSADGKAWQMLNDSSKNALKSPNEVPFKADNIRYVRVTFLGTSAGGWGSIWELQVHGTETEIVKADSAAADDSKVLGDVRVPAEFDVTVFASPPAANYPVYVAAAPDGTVFVSSDKNGSLDRKPLRGSIIRLKDLDGDGRADQSNLYVSDVDSPRGAVWDHDRLYLVHPPHLSAFIDHNGDGVSDEQKILVKDIAFGFKDRPADHTTNGLTLGIDGWLYIAGGDFGFMEAEGTDGRKLQHRGGGVIRVRPDGTELQIYSTGTRNILDVAMSPALDAFCRDNTNDGGGWDMRFHHFTGLEDHGYPRLYMNFPDEHIKPLIEYGGGSGCGGGYLNEPGFPDRYADVPLTCDWGRNFVFSHHVKPSGATFKDDCREFIGMTRATDVDVDAMSRIYAASWRGATFNYTGEDVGYIVGVTPKGYKPEPLPDFNKANDAELVKLLESPSARRRMEAQRALVRKGVSDPTAKALITFAEDKAKPLYGRIAAAFTIRQGTKPEVANNLLNSLARQDEAIRPFAVRAAADREGQMQDIDTGAVTAGCASSNPRLKLESAIAIARLDKPGLAPAILPLLGDADPVIAHTAFRALAQLKAQDACFTVVDKADAPYPQRAGALLALMRMHEPAVVDGLIARLEKENDSARRRGLLSALCRLHFHDGPWKGDSWGTRPDTRGPYYQPEKWSESDRIMTALTASLATAQGEEAAWLASEMTRNRIEDDAAAKQLLTLAASDPKLRSTLISQLVKKDNVPQEAIPLLTKSASDADTSADERADAIVILTRTDNAGAWHALPQALSMFSGKGGRRGGEKAEQAFLGAPKLENFHTWFEELAAMPGTEPAQWADAALLALSARNTGSPESREQSAKALEAGWADAKRRAQILSAVAEIKHRAWSHRVLASLNDPDKMVAAAADRAVKALKLDPADASLPKIESMKPEDVIAAVLKTKGDSAIGAQIYQQATCVNCHTVSKDAPPRGPFLGNIADTYKRPDLAAAILDPNKTIAQGFVTNFFTLKKGDPVMGFVVQESATEVTIRNQAGVEQKIAAADIQDRQKLPNSLMPPGLANQLTVKDLASLLDYLELLAKEQKK